MSRQHWSTAKIKDLSEYLTVGFVGSMSNLFQEDGIPLLRGQNIKPYVLDMTNLKYISEETHRKWRKSALKAGDVVIVRVGYPGTACVIPEGLGDLNAASLVIVRPAKDKLDPYYLSYVLNSDWGKANVLGRLVGAAQQVFNTSTAAELEIPAPDISTQRRIAGILSAYDELIANNQRRIAALEQMARALYREWFVYFRAPGVVMGADGMPEGWEVNVVDDIVQRIPVGKRFEQKTVLETGAIPVLDQGRTGVIGYHNEEPGVHASEDNPVIVFANHTCYQRIIHFPFSAIQNVLPVIPKPSSERNIYWLHWVLSGLVVFNDYKGHWPELIAKEVYVPPFQLCETFGDIVGPMHRLIWYLESSNANLRRTRDLLLPRLMSGRVEVNPTGREGTLVFG